MGSVSSRCVSDVSRFQNVRAAVDWPARESSKEQLLAAIDAAGRQVWLAAAVKDAMDGPTVYAMLLESVQGDTLDGASLAPDVADVLLNLPALGWEALKALKQFRSVTLPHVETGEQAQRVLDQMARARIDGLVNVLITADQHCPLDLSLEECSQLDEVSVSLMDDAFGGRFHNASNTRAHFVESPNRSRVRQMLSEHAPQLNVRDMKEIVQSLTFKTQQACSLTVDARQLDILLRHDDLVGLLERLLDRGILEVLMNGPSRPAPGLR